MSISRDTAQDCTNSTTNGTSITATWPTTPPANKLLLAAALLSTTISHVTPPSGYTLVERKDDLSGVFSIHLYAKIAAGNETGINFNMSGQPNGDVYVAGAQLAGAISSSVANAVDKTANNTNDGSQHALLATGTTATTGQADDYAFSLIGVSGPISAPSWTSAALVHSMNKLFTGDRVLSATGAISDTGHWTSSQFASGLIAVFKAAPATASYWSTSC